MSRIGRWFRETWLEDHSEEAVMDYKLVYGTKAHERLAEFMITIGVLLGLAIAMVIFSFIEDYTSGLDALTYTALLVAVSLVVHSLWFTRKLKSKKAVKK